MRRLFWMLWLLLLPAAAHGATYYVAADGADTAAGTADTAAWRTLARVAACTTIVAGDSVMLRRGDTWRETLELPAGGAAADSPVTYGAYGAGADVGLTEDIDGNPITGAPDIGAYEYIDEEEEDEMDGFPDVPVLKGMLARHEVSASGAPVIVKAESAITTLDASTQVLAFINAHDTATIDMVTAAADTDGDRIRARRTKYRRIVPGVIPNITFTIATGGKLVIQEIG